MPYYSDLGALTPGADLPVKAYVVSGTTVWGSYQSPEANNILITLKQQINRFGAGLDVNGLIGPKTVDAIKHVVASITPSSPQWDKGVALAHMAAGGPESVAKQALVAWSYVKDIGDEYGWPTTAPPKTSPPPAPSKPTSSSTAAPVFTAAYAAQPESYGGGFMSSIINMVKTPLGLVALAIGGVLIYRSKRGKGGGGRRRGGATARKIRRMSQRRRAYA